MTGPVSLSARALGYDIRAAATPAGGDWTVTVLGGCAPHVGSVSLAEPDGGVIRLRTLLRENHRDQIVGDRFARRLAGATGGTVCVICGIHYDSPTREDLASVVACADGLLEELCQRLSRESGPIPE